MNFGKPKSKILNFYGDFMKLMLTVVTLFLSLSALASPRIHEVKVYGTRARLMSNFTIKYGSSDGGMGHVYSSTGTITCAKKIDEVNFEKSEIYCDITSEDMTNRISTKKEEQFNDAFEMRELINELTKAEKIINPSLKKTDIQKIVCIGTSVQGHVFDSLEFEANVGCTITY
jgi:hypothetical protein